MRKRVFIAHQLSGDLQANLESAVLWCRWALFVRDVNPIAPYLTLIAILDEGIPGEREAGMTLGDEYIEGCDVLWVCGPKPRPESHVWEEIKTANNYNIQVVDYTDLILPADIHSVKSTTDHPALSVDKSNLVSPKV